MRKILFLVLPVFIVVTLIYSCMEQEKPKPEAQAQVVSTDDLVKKGEYLVTIAGCNDCHSPKRMGARGPELIPELMLSGYPGDRPVPAASKDAFDKGWAVLNYDLTSFAGPWGESFAANLTPDETGIGNWTEEQFKKAFTQGKFMGIDGSRMLLPPMPWQNYVSMKDEDVKAIYYYLKSLQPVKNVVPEPIPPEQLMAGKK
jgi:hypothetical protein